MANNEYKIGDIIDLALRRYNFNDTITCGKVVAAYNDIVGPLISKLTLKTTFDATTRILHVQLSSPALRQEMMLKVGDLLKAINEKLQSPTVSKIRFY